MSKVREYEGNDITILYDVARCYHAEECIHGAPGIFQKDARPWVQPNGESAEHAASVIQRCPTGALHYRAKDESLNEKPQAENTVTVTANGPLLAHGHLEIALPEGPLDETRAAFCRCGASNNKPFCDGSHARVGFTDPGPKAAPKSAAGPPAAASSDGKLAVTPAPNGPLLASGSMTIRNSAGEVATRMQQATAFCRCGASASKPFCDGSHASIGFTG